MDMAQIIIDAKDALGQAVKKSPNNPTLLLNLGAHYQELGMYIEAAEKYQKAYSFSKAPSILEYLISALFLKLNETTNLEERGGLWRRMNRAFKLMVEDGVNGLTNLDDYINHLKTSTE